MNVKLAFPLDNIQPKMQAASYMRAYDVLLAASGCPAYM